MSLWAWATKIGHNAAKDKINKNFIYKKILNNKHELNIKKQTKNMPNV